MTDIVSLIEQQINRCRIKRPDTSVTVCERTLLFHAGLIWLMRTKSILLVGGFGSSQYLRQRVEEHFPDVQVLQPRDAWSAIVRYDASVFVIISLILMTII